MSLVQEGTRKGSIYCEVDLDDHPVEKCTKLSSYDKGVREYALLSPRGNAKRANTWRGADPLCILAAGNGQVLSPVTNRVRVQKQTGTT